MEKVRKTMFVCFIGAFVILSGYAWAGVGPAGTGPCCVIANPGAGALALKGTMALVWDPGTLNVDITLRLERSGDLRFFRLNVPLNLQGQTDAQIICLILNPCATEDPELREPVTVFVNEILNAFFPGLTACDTKLAITAGSIANAQGNLECLEGNTPENCYIPGTHRVSTLGDLTIYVVPTSRFRLANEYVSECFPETVNCSSSLPSCQSAP